MNGKNKKVIAGALVLSMALSTTAFAGMQHVLEEKKSTVVAATTTFVNGDINKDGNVTLDDAQLALKGALKIKKDFTEAELYAADVDSNGKLELADAQLILKQALRIQNLPSKQPPAASEVPATGVPTETQTPGATDNTGTTENPGTTVLPSESPSASATTAPTRIPQPSDTGVQTTERPKLPQGTQLPTVEAADYVVTGIAVDMIASNGAVEENGVYTFTDANKEAKTGIKFEWPFANRTDLRRTVSDAGVTLDDIVSVPRDYLEQGTLLKKLEAGESIDYDYPRPVWDNGVSISFWSKQKWQYEGQSNFGPLLVIKRSYYCDRNIGDFTDGYGGPRNSHGQKEDCDFGLVISANGSVSFLAGDDGKNGFRAANYILGEDDEWTHYTVTIANDFITVYVNGQELVYPELSLDKDAFVECFNGGFMTKYNPAGLVTQDMVDADIRNYLTAPSVGNAKNPAYYELNGEFTTNWEATLIGNSAYKNDPTAAECMLLMDLLTEDNVEMYIGGLEGVCCIDSSRTGTATYDTPSGSQVAGVMCYESELKPAEVAAIYEDSKNTYKDVLGLQ